MAKINKRSEALKLRHREAKRQREYFQKSFETEKTPAYSSFLRKETPLEQRFVSYEVSYQVSYQGATDALESRPATFIVIGLRGQESQVKNRTMNMLLDSKGKFSNNQFRGNTLNAIENSTDIKIRPRGLEESQKKVNFQDIQNATENGFVVKELDSEFKFKNKKNREGIMKLDIRHFL